MLRRPEIGTILLHAWARHSAPVSQFPTPVAVRGALGGSRAGGRGFAPRRPAYGGVYGFCNGGHLRPRIALVRELSDKPALRRKSSVERARKECIDLLRQVVRVRGPTHEPRFPLD